MAHRRSSLLNDRSPCDKEGFDEVTALRKLLSILAVLLLVLPLLAPLLAVAQSGESGIAACCRRNGKHHCAMSVAEKNQLSSGEVAWKWTAPEGSCPYCPAPLARSHADEPFLTTSAQTSYAEISNHAAGIAQTDSKYRTAHDRSRPKRGPPSQTFS